MPPDYIAVVSTDITAGRKFGDGVSQPFLVLVEDVIPARSRLLDARMLKPVAVLLPKCAGTAAQVEIKDVEA
jgi:hypothetical protein